MKRLLGSIIFCFTIFIPSLSPECTAAEEQKEILDLRESINNITQGVRAQLHAHPNAGFVIVLGPTGSGKSTLINLLAGKPFIAQEEDGDLDLSINTFDPLDGFIISTSNVVGTRLPCSWYDGASNIVFWDCPGFGDPRGPGVEIINAFSVRELFRPNTKVLLVVKRDHVTIDRASKFLKFLHTLTTVFPDNQQLNQGFSLIVSNQRGAGDIPLYLRRKVLPLTQLEVKEMTPEVRILLRDLAAHPAPRIASFPCPADLGPYVPNMQSIRQAIASSNYMANPNPRIILGADALLHVDDIGRGLNDYIVGYVRNQGRTEIIKYCNDLINTYSRPIENLRGEFIGLVRNLENLPRVVNAQNVRLFTQELTRIFKGSFDVSGINNTIDQIAFFKGLRESVTYDTLRWIDALNPTIRRIQKLSNVPEVQVDGNILNVKSIIIGTSDIITALHGRKNINRVDVFSLNTLFLDADITEAGIALNFLAPNWKVIDQRVIDINGISGARGADGAPNTGEDGQPGLPGANGGNFYGKGKVFKGIRNLTINTNGGSGGPGGNGGSGVPGATGPYGNMMAYVDTPQKIPGPGGDLFGRCRKYTDRIYNGMGSAGFPGGTGGKAGQGGVGGYAGINIIDGIYPWNPNLEDGAIGPNGEVGIGGPGGMHGLNYQGRIHINEEFWRKKFSDNIIVPIGYVAAGPNAPQGQPGVGLNNAGQQGPSAKHPRDENIAVGYAAYRRQETLSSMRVFFKDIS